MLIDTDKVSKSRQLFTFLKVVCRRSVQSGCIHYMPHGTSDTLNHTHVALSYYIEMTSLYHAPQISEVGT